MIKTMLQERNNPDKIRKNRESKNLKTKALIPNIASAARK